MSIPPFLQNHRFLPIIDFCRTNKIHTVMEWGSGAYGATHIFLLSGCKLVISLDVIPELTKPIIHEKDRPPPNLPDERYHRYPRPKEADLIVADDLHLPIKNDIKFDLIFIDSSHGYEHTKSEIELAKNYTNLLLFDDYTISNVNTAISRAGLNEEGRFRGFLSNELYYVKIN